MASPNTPNPMRSESTSDASEIASAAERLLSRISNELIELEPGFGLDSDLFGAGLDSMAIMQVLLIVEEEFGVKLPDASIKRETFSTARRIAEAVLAPESQTGW